MHEFRTHKCDELTIENVGEKVKLSGWISTIRDLGAVMFIDLRDHYGVTQLVIGENEEFKATIRKIGEESTICVEGEVLQRDEANYNPKIPTGQIEVKPEELKVLGKCTNMLPFQIENSHEVREDLRLQYRFLDLRNEKLHRKIIFRSEVLKKVRQKMDELGFVEIQTPILTGSSPEGARDFLVPSRLNPGTFYALPQAPQQYKQLLMVSGFDKYYQIAPCFRDEDPRADRSPGEFYQLDFEMSFATQEDVFKVIEKVVGETFEELTSWDVTKAPFLRIPFKEAMLKYGTDKPDLRNPIIIQDATEVFKNTDFIVFKGKTVRVMKLPNCKDKTRSFFDSLTEFAINECKAKGLAWIKFNDDMTISGSITKFITDEIYNGLVELTNPQPGDAILFTAGTEEAAASLAGDIRIEAGKRLDLLEKNTYKFCWIVDFPMYQLDDNGKVEFNHNPFSMPQGGLEALNTMDPLDIYAYQYDLVCNGYELASGAVRNHDPEIMIRAFEIAGYDKSVVESKFPALFNAFHYGAPPHAGAAPGIDRMIMLLADESNIREVIAFPKNSRAQDLLMNAPGKVGENQLKEVHIKLDLKD